MEHDTSPVMKPSMFPSRVKQCILFVIISISRKHTIQMQQDQELPPERKSDESRTILIVEDDVGVGSFLVAAIAQETSYHAYLVTDAFQALKAFSTDKIDLMILDYSLPKMNGIELYDRLQTLQGSSVPPVVMISAHLPTNELAKRRLPSMRKPLELQHFLDTIEKMLA